MPQNQDISAACAVQMYEALKQGPRTAGELATLAGLQETTVEKWIAHMQMFGRVRIGGAGELAPWYRWVSVAG